jgi:hypothetical protein
MGCRAQGTQPESDIRDCVSQLEAVSKSILSVAAESGREQPHSKTRMGKEGQYRPWV